MKKLLLPLLLCLAVIETFAAGNTWTQKNDVRHPGQNVTQAEPRIDAAYFTIGSQGYIVGGGASFLGYREDTWCFDTITGLWTQKANIPGDERLQAAGFSLNGKGYVGTGRNQYGQPSTEFYQYDPDNNVWIQKASFAGVPRTGAIGFGIGSKCYIGLGNSTSQNAYLNDLWEYDTLTDVWTQKAGLWGAARAFAVAFVLNGKAYVGTGASANSDLKDFFQYNPANNTWISRASLPAAAAGRSSAMGCAANGKGYVACGFDGSYWKDFYEYNDTTNVWTTKAIYTGGRRSKGFAFGIGDKVYVGGGLMHEGELADMRVYNRAANAWFHATPSGGAWATKGMVINGKGYIGYGGYTDFYSYSPFTDTWAAETCITDTFRGGGISFSANGRGYVGMGNMKSVNRRDIWEYNPVTKTWAQKAYFPSVARLGAMSFAINNKGYVGGGTNNRDFWMYNPTSNTWTARDSLPMVRSNPSTFVIGKRAYMTLGVGASGNTSPTDTWAYNSQTNQWTQVANFPVTYRQGAFSFSAGSQGYVGMGSIFYRDFYQFDPVSDSWATVDSFPGTWRSDGAAFEINGLGYLGGGNALPPTEYPQWWLYEPNPSIFSNEAVDTMICHGETISIPYSAGGVYAAGNLFSVQLSDSTGSFAAPVTVGLVPAVYSGSVSVVIPNTVPPGHGYKMRVVSSTPAVTGTVVEQTFTVRSSVTPTISITPSANPSCQGSNITFTASAQNEGASPVYRWKSNGTSVGSNAPTYTATSQNGAKIWVELISSISCAVPDTAISDTVTVVKVNLLAPAVGITTTADSICAGTSVTYTATDTNTYNPVYTWYKNGTIVQNSNANTYTSASLNHNDSIWAVVTTSFACNAINKDTSNKKKLGVVIPPVTPTVINFLGDTVYRCPYSNITDFVNITNGGSNPRYQWIKNGQPMLNDTLPIVSFPPYTINDYDSVWVLMTSNALCATGVTVQSDRTVFRVRPSLPTSVDVVASANNICGSAPVTFTATPTDTGGWQPTYEWRKNGTVVGTNSNVYTDAAPANSDVIVCRLLGVPCSPNIITDTVIMNVTQPLNPNVTISASAATICSGTTVTITANATGTGANPQYIWYKNNVNTGNIGPVYISSSFAAGDVIKCVVQITAPCTAATADTSNSITMNVTQPVQPGVTVNANRTIICQSGSVTFTAVPVSGGSSPSYLWYKNGSSVGFAGNPYTTANINNGDQFSVRLTSNATCVSPAQVTSTPVTISISVPATPVVTYSNNVLSSNQPYNNQWYLNGGIIGNGIASTYTPTVNGNYSVMYTDSIGCVSGMSNAVAVVLTGINEADESGIFLYPNPAMNELYINATNSKVLEITIYNNVGVLVKHIAAVETNMIDVSELPQGMYIADVKTSTGIKCLRWTKL